MVVNTKPFAGRGADRKRPQDRGQENKRRPRYGRGRATCQSFFINRPIVAMVISIIFVILGLVTMAVSPWLNSRKSSRRRFQLNYHL